MNAVDADFRPGTGGWTLLTAHGRVLVQIARDPDARIRDLAADCLLTERTVQAIVNDLEEAGYVSHVRVGRRNRYTVHSDLPFRHPVHADYPIGPVLGLLTEPPARPPQPLRPARPARPPRPAAHPPAAETSDGT